MGNPNVVRDVRVHVKRGTILLSVVLALLVGGHQPAAWACSCAGGTRAELFDRADHVFVGVVIGAADPGADQEGPVSTGREITWTFDVDAVEKGDVTDPVDVGSAADGVSCGYVFSEGVRYRVYVHQARDGGLQTGLCSGNQELGRASSQPSPVGSDEPVSSDGRDGDGGSAAPPPGAEPAAGGVEPVGAESDDAAGIGGLAIGLIATAGVVAGGGLLLLRRGRISPR